MSGEETTENTEQVRFSLKVEKWDSGASEASRDDSEGSEAFRALEDLEDV